MNGRAPAVSFEKKILTETWQVDIRLISQIILFTKYFPSIGASSLLCKIILFKLLSVTYLDLHG